MDSEKQRLLENWLDAALKRRGAVEPRLGLEGRVWASLRAESKRIPALAWPWRAAWFAAAAAVLIGASLFLARRTGSAQRATEVQIPAKHDALPIPKPVEMPAVAGAQPRHRPARASVRPAVARALPRSPRLPQFPSPQPLSEQEQMLARYVLRFPREAVLMARAQTALSKQEAVEEQQKPSFDLPETPDEQNQ